MPEPVVEPEREEPDKTEKTSPKVELNNLLWIGSEWEFNERAEIQAEANLPQAYHHLTRIEFQVWALTPDGRREAIDRQEGFLKEGRATAIVTLYWPGYRKEGAALERCEMVFTAKHRESKPAESAKIEVRAPAVLLGKVWVRLLSPKGVPLSGMECGLKGPGKPLPSGKTDANGELLWEGIPLAEWNLVFKGEEGNLAMPVPWLESGSDIHVCRVKSVSQILGSPASKAGLAKRTAVLGFASLSDFKQKHEIGPDASTDTLSGELSSYWLGT